MKKTIALLVLLVASATVASAQTPFTAADVSVAANGKMFSSALSAYRLHNIGSSKFKIGYGARLTNYFAGADPGYVTAPANVSEGNFFKKQNSAKLDTLTLGKGQINSLNAAIYLGYDISEKLSIGFNIDAIGVSFGANQSGSVKTNGKATAVPTAKVSPVNILLTGDNDWGSLNSELYARYSVSEKLHLRLGVSFLFSEYKTQQIASNFNNDRFRYKSFSPMLGLSYSLGK